MYPQKAASRPVASSSLNDRKNPKSRSTRGRLQPFAPDLLGFLSGFRFRAWIHNMQLAFAILVRHRSDEYTGCGRIATMRTEYQPTIFGRQLNQGLPAFVAHLGDFNHGSLHSDTAAHGIHVTFQGTYYQLGSSRHRRMDSRAIPVSSFNRLGPLVAEFVTRPRSLKIILQCSFYRFRRSHLEGRHRQ